MTESGNAVGKQINSIGTRIRNIKKNGTLMTRMLQMNTACPEYSGDKK